MSPGEIRNCKYAEIQARLESETAVSLRLILLLPLPRALADCYRMILIN